MRRKCKTCKYRAAATDTYGCDYLLITGHSRGCPVEKCTAYEKGNKIPISDRFHTPISKTSRENAERWRKEREGLANEQ